MNGPDRTPLRPGNGTHRVLLAGLVVVGLIILAHVLDGWAFQHLAIPSFAETDAGRLLRVLGFLPTWGIVAVAIVLLRDRSLALSTRMRPGALLFFTAALGGIVAELTKLLVRRLRPSPDTLDYVFRPFSVEPFNTAGLGMPSSHALVAFSAAAMLSRLYPQARALWWLLGAGCAFSRVAAGAHWLSDTAVSAALGWLVARIVWDRWGPDRQDEKARG